MGMNISLRFIIAFLFFTNLIFAQFPDNTWLLGYGGGVADLDSFGISVLKFDDNKLIVGGE